MRRTIKSLHHKAEYYSKRVHERLATNETQNKEIGELVDMISTSANGCQELSRIFSQADSKYSGMGKVLEDIWKNDHTDWNQFKEDQEMNGKFSFCAYMYFLIQYMVL